jgi:hypothetical protein
LTLTTFDNLHTNRDEILNILLSNLHIKISKIEMGYPNPHNGSEIRYACKRNSVRNEVDALLMLYLFKICDWEDWDFYKINPEDLHYTVDNYLIPSLSCLDFNLVDTNFLRKYKMGFLIGSDSDLQSKGVYGYTTINGVLSKIYDNGKAFDSMIGVITSGRLIENRICIEGVFYTTENYFALNYYCYGD